MVVTATAQQRPFNGVRPINLSKDIPQVLKLLELCFGAAMQLDGKRLLSSNETASFLWRVTPAASKLALGYVWESNGRIVGNVTILTTKNPHRYLVVNVAVHPEYRRKGIAKMLMEAVTNLVVQRQGTEILLQVVQSNLPARSLYEQLNYATLGSMTAWYAPISRLRQTAELLDAPPLYIRELRRQEWQAAYALDLLSLPGDLNWPEPPTTDAYQTGLWRRLSNFVNGRQQETWVTTNSQNELVGMASIASEWGRSHAAAIRVHPSWRGQLERPLLAKLIRRLYYLPRRNVCLEHPDDDILMNQLLRDCNLHPRRTLTHMKLTL